MRFEQPYPATDSIRIAQFEKERGFALPKAYREFLLSCNGGSRPVDKCYAIIPGWNELLVSQFLGLTESSASSISATRFSNFSKDLGALLLVIGFDVADQELILDLRPKSYGHIYVRNFIYPRRSTLLVDDSGFAPADYEEAELLVPIARSFEALMAMLGPEPN